jgi:hypothetical protein
MPWPGADEVFDPLPLWFAMADFTLFLGILGCVACFLFVQDLLERQRRNLIVLPCWIGVRFCWACVLCAGLLCLKFLFVEEDLEAAHASRWGVALLLLVGSGLLIALPGDREAMRWDKACSVIAGCVWILLGLLALFLMNGVRWNSTEHWTSQSSWLFTAGAAILAVPPCIIEACRSAAGPFTGGWPG